MAKASGGDDKVQYVDMGDHTLVIDSTGDAQRRYTLPKSTRDIGVSQKMRTELEARIESEYPEDEQEDALANLPPVETEEDVEAREKAASEAIAKADKAAAPEEAPAPATKTASSSSG